MGDNELAVGHAVLAASSAWSYIKCKDLKYPRIAFLFYLANGLLGMLEYLQPNQRVKRMRLGFARWGRPLYSPLIAAEAFLFAGFNEQYSYFHLIFPIVWLIMTEFLNKNLKQEYLDVSAICNSISIGYSAFIVNNMFGGLCAVLNLVAFLGMKIDSMEYLVLISCCNVAAVQFFKQFFKF